MPTQDKLRKDAERGAGKANEEQANRYLDLLDQIARDREKRALADKLGRELPNDNEEPANQPYI